MALDGIAVSNIVHELKDSLLGGRVDKIYQPLSDEIIFSVRSIGSNFKLLLSANSSHPRLHITSISKDNPMTPPMFCMVMRKYVAGGKIVGISQPNFERIVNIDIESMNEMGDMTAKKLIIEIMGKHSNIILTDENYKILDCIKHVSHEKSSVREVLPGKTYVLPPSQDKKNPLELSKNIFINDINDKSGTKLQALIYQNYTGISPVMASEICFRAELDPSSYCEQLKDDEKEKLYSAFVTVKNDVIDNNYTPEIVYDTKTSKIVDFSSLNMAQFSEYEKKNYDSISELLENFYSEKDNTYHIAQKAHDMRKLIVSNIERCVKKKEIQIKTLKDIKDKDIWKIKGELLTANIYSIEKGMTKFKTTNFYDEAMPEIEINIDPTLTPSENAQRYFSKYNKAKRTLAALDIQIKQNDEELMYLEGILSAVDSSTDEADISEIKEELMEAGFVKRKRIQKGKAPKPKKSKPLHYISSDGYDIYVGKSNTQNDELTLRFAMSNDIWLHTKDIPGSHVIISTNDTGTAPDNTLLEAANLSAFNSKAKNSSSVPVDYALRKNVKKPSGAKPGMVIYENNKTLYVTPNEQAISELKKL